MSGGVAAIISNEKPSYHLTSFSWKPAQVITLDRKKLMLMLMLRLSSLAHKLLMLMFMLASLVRTGQVFSTLLVPVGKQVTIIPRH